MLNRFPFGGDVAAIHDDHLHFRQTYVGVDRYFDSQHLAWHHVVGGQIVGCYVPWDDEGNAPLPTRWIGRHYHLVVTPQPSQGLPVLVDRVVGVHPELAEAGDFCWFQGSQNGLEPLFFEHGPITGYLEPLQCYISSCVIGL